MESNTTIIGVIRYKMKDHNCIYDQIRVVPRRIRP